VAEHVWSLAGQGRLELAGLLSAGEPEQWGRLVTDLQLAAEGRGNHRQHLAEAAEDLRRRRQRQELQLLKKEMDTNKDAALREIGSRLRRPDPRRRPKLT
jgi:hypothetical protein